jgi:hypothetical protein
MAIYGDDYSDIVASLQRMQAENPQATNGASFLGGTEGPMGTGSQQADISPFSPQYDIAGSSSSSGDQSKWTGIMSGIAKSVGSNPAIGNIISSIYQKRGWAPAPGAVGQKTNVQIPTAGGIYGDPARFKSLLAQLIRR